MALGGCKTVDCDDASPVDSGARALPTGTWEHAPGHCVLRVTTPRIGVCLVELRGQLEAADVEPLINATRYCIESAPTSIFVDLNHVSSYHSSLRLELTRLLLEFEPQLTEVVVLATAPMTRMAATVTSVAIRLVEVLETPALFRQRYQRRLMHPLAAT